MRAAIGVTALASVVFYGLHDPRFVPLMLASIVINFFLGKKIQLHAGSTHAKRLLQLALALNIGTLFIFKYLVFSVLAINELAGLSLAVPAIVLPIGISFYTFTQVAYLVDCWRGRAHDYRFMDYMLFVTFFPHLIAGPILQHSPFMAQIENGKFARPALPRVYIGVVFFIIGLSKKVLIADSLSPLVSTVFDNAATATFYDAWLGALLYTLQLYYDFSGYSEMAVGLALWMNLRIPINFNSPYKANSIIDFWRRWHISLSYFLRNYLYIPLGGSRVSPARHYVNLFITMLLGGIWHGAGWTYVLWGAMHGGYLVINHAWRKHGVPLHRFVARGITFIAIVVAWVVFRAKSLEDAMLLLGAMFTFKGTAFLLTYTYSPLWISAAVAALLLWTQTMPNTQQMAIRRNPSKLFAFALAWALLFSIFSLSHPSEFLYFQF